MKLIQKHGQALKPYRICKSTVRKQYQWATKENKCIQFHSLIKHVIPIIYQP